MNERDKRLILFAVLVILIELGLFIVFLDLTMRGRTTTLWLASGWPWIVFPFLSGWLFFVRKQIAGTWLILFGATVFSLWYQLYTYGWSLLNGGMLVIGLGHMLVVCLLAWSWRLRPRTKEIPD